MGVGGLFLVQTLEQIELVYSRQHLKKLQFNSEEENTFAITDQGIVEIGTVVLEMELPFNDVTQGKLSLDLGTLSIRRNIMILLELQV